MLQKCGAKYPGPLLPGKGLRSCHPFRHQRLSERFICEERLQTPSQGPNITRRKGHTRIPHDLRQSRR